MHFPAVTDSLFLFDPLCPRVPSVEHRLPVRNEQSTIPEMRFLGGVTWFIFWDLTGRPAPVLWKCISMLQ